ncbi:MAG TPA: NAD-dependent DNA ligase LigA [Candidatus Paceibacterota bacterium]|nr:NAD-dependent DNA ligase LigA [Candidatus Paceibacterota bacterium]
MEFTEKKEAKDRISRLKKLIDYHRTLYHTFDSPEIDDSAFDTLKNELEELENKYPDLVTSDSPTQKVGGRPLDKFEKIPHESPMLSFNDAFSEQEMTEWLERLKNYLGYDFDKGNSKEPLFYCELKIDGLAIELIYENGEFVQGATRGDGFIGEDVTQNLKTINKIPKKLEQLGKWKIPQHLVVRGEVFITKKELEKINKEQIKKGLKPFANARNLAAGSIRQLDPSIVELRKLQSFQYDIVTDMKLENHEDKHKVLASWGFNINPHNKSIKTIKEVLEFRDFWESKRDNLDYEIDGIVVMVNKNKIFNQAGAVGKAPRGAIAYKFSPRQATTIVEDVIVQVGRTGVLTPVAVLKPVNVGGTTITHATLHNFDEIERLGVKMGDTVIVTRSGDVIPKIIQVIKDLRSGREKNIKIPLICPVDGSKVVKDGVFIKCSNPRCGAKNRSLILHFSSRNAFDIRGLGDKIVDRFLDEGLISGPADIFELKEGDISVLERFGEKSAKNLIQQIEKAKKISLDRFLYALGIFHVGYETARGLAKKFMSSKNKVTIELLGRFFSSLSPQEFEEMSDIGPKVSKSIKDWFEEKRNQILLQKLSKNGVELEPFREKTTGVFAKLNICLTGSLESMSRPRAKEIIENNGGHFNSDVTSKTNILIAGDDPGSKLEKAKKMGIEIWDEKIFLTKIK